MTEDEGKVRLDQETPLTVQSRESRTEMRFRVADWQRIRRDIRELKGWSTAWFSASTLLLGISVAAGLSLITLYNNPNPPNHWVVTTHIAIASAAGFGGVICAITGSAGWFRYRRRRNRLETELDLIESTFPWGAAKPPSGPTKMDVLLERLGRKTVATKRGKQRFVDGCLDKCQRLKKKIEDLPDEEWQVRRYAIDQDMIYEENRIRATLFDHFPPGTDDFFDSDDGFDKDDYDPHSQEGAVTYMGWRLTRLGQIRKRIS